MPELRQNRFTKEWVIMATERAKRPEELTSRREPRVAVAHAPACPLCPGNEHLSPPDVLKFGNGTSPWMVRVLPNKFPALAREGEPVWTVQRSRRTINGVGIHDVIIESPDHSTTTALLPEEHVDMILRAYKLRYDQASADPRIASVTIFKNHGGTAGASLEHPHSQMLAAPVISAQVRDRLHEALRHHDEYGECMFCEVISEELGDGSRVVIQTEHFVAVEPYASNSPFATHIYPRRHMSSFGMINDLERRDLAHVLRTFLAKLYYGLDDPDFNYTIRTAPAETGGVRYYHWYLSVIPRITKVAGFELGSGMFINTVLPEAAAEFLRNVKVETARAAGA